MSDIGPWIFTKPLTPYTSSFSLDFVLAEPVTVTRAIISRTDMSRDVWLLEEVGIDHCKLLAAYNTEVAANKALKRHESRVVRSCPYIEMVIFPNLSSKVRLSNHIRKHSKQLLPEYLKCDYLDGNQFRVRKVSTKGIKA